MKKLKLGVIGLSEGNGHPYSWSAIFNGFEPNDMKNCGFPVIPEYLSKQNFPKDFLTDLGEVTHVWTQDPKISESIAKASRIKHIVDKPIEMIGHVDAILLARDDAENHLEMAKLFLEHGLPIFIDKPFALSLSEAHKMLNYQVFDEQIFTCSSLRYAAEFNLSKTEKEKLGIIKYVEGSVMKKWETYGIHILEPIINQLPNRGKLLKVESIRLGDIHIVLVKWENCLANLRLTGKIPSDLELSFYGLHGHLTKTFADSFACFKTSLKTFIEQITLQQNIISRSETLELVEIIEKGKC